ncbi:2-polyprenyl-3-methyl-6-methoxy-1,4-benzoquinone monooxygenase [Paralcaligenes ginsengisoli]|jgi:ubiquinone biosynthesis monooxygenase Coq7
MFKQDVVPGAVALPRRLNRADGVFAEIGRALQVLDGAVHAGRPNPAGKPGPAAPDLSVREQKHAAALMRVNHVGEVCAQALYRGQAVFCRDEKIKELFRHAASEEVDHLVWCQDRLHELQSRPSYLNPLWYAGSFSLGLVAGYAGVSRNLGFMAETESQVEQHLNTHLNKLPADDVRSRQIVEQMRNDEVNHRATAEHHGGLPLPRPARWLMRGMAKVMTGTAYWV